MRYAEPLPPTLVQLIADTSAVEKRFPRWPIRPDSWRVSHAKHTNFWAWFFPCTAAICSPLESASEPRPDIDTPSAAFYRIYQFLIADCKYSVRLRDELEYFCKAHPEWAVKDIPDPARELSMFDEIVEPATYAALAGLARLMCAWFNRRVSVGLPAGVGLDLDLEKFVSVSKEMTVVRRMWEQEPAWAMRVQPLSKPVYVSDENGNLVKDKEKVCEIMRKMGIIMREPHIYFV